MFVLIVFSLIEIQISFFRLLFTVNESKHVEHVNMQTWNFRESAVYTIIDAAHKEKKQ